MNGIRWGSHMRGFSLIEVLVALIVLSIGLLGVCALAFSGTRANDSAYLRTQATYYAYNILDDMRANRAVATQKGFDYDGTGKPFNCDKPPHCVDSECTPDDAAQYDVCQWETNLNTLPAIICSGSETLCHGIITTVTKVTLTTATITVQWNDTRAGGATQSVKIESVL